MSDGGICNFPMEVCIISDNQRVKPHQQTAKQAQDMIKVNLFWVVFKQCFIFKITLF